jgi:hypothetical protein
MVDLLSDFVNHNANALGIGSERLDSEFTQTLLSIDQA